MNGELPYIVPLIKRKRIHFKLLQIHKSLLIDFLEVDNKLLIKNKNKLLLTLKMNIIIKSPHIMDK